MVANIQVKDIFRKHYAQMCDVLKTEDGLLKYFVSANLITYDDESDIMDQPLAQKGSILLKHFSGPVSNGYTDGFLTMLNIMQSHGKATAQELANTILLECQKVMRADQSEFY